MIPDVLLRIRETIGQIVGRDEEIKSLIKEGRVYRITIGVKGIELTEHKLLKKRKKPNFTKEEIERRNLLRDAIKDKTGVIFISGLLTQLLREIKKHRFRKFDDRTRKVLGGLYNETIKDLGKELKNGKGIEQNRNRIIDVS